MIVLDKAETRAEAVCLNCGGSEFQYGKLPELRTVATCGICYQETAGEILAVSTLMETSEVLRGVVSKEYHRVFKD